MNTTQIDNDSDLQIKLCSVSKRYHSRLVLHQINLEIHQGKALALVGENGCGKSTLLRIIGGLIFPFEGERFVSRNIHMSYMPDHFEKLSFTLEDYIYTMMKIEGIYDANHLAKLNDFYKGFSLEDMIQTKMKDLSKGTLQKTAVIQAMLGDYDVILMDEPLSGQDYPSQQYFVEQMKYIKQAGTTLIMACHEPFLVKELADDVFKISHSELIDGKEYLQFDREVTHS